MYKLEVAPGITFVEGVHRGRFPNGNILVLEGTGARAVVDTGAGEEVLRAVKASGAIDVVINTHYHIDHVRGNSLFSGAEFWCPTVEAGALSSLEDLIRTSGWDLLGPEEGKAVFDGFGWSPTPVTRGLNDGEVLDFGGLKATVLHLPGHTPGHFGLWFEQEKVVFSADIDLSTFGPWYGDLLSSIDDYLDSVRRLAYIVGGSVYVKDTGYTDDGHWMGWLERTCQNPEARPVSILTSHRRPLTYDDFAKRLPIFKAHFAEREERLLALLKEEGPLSLEDLTLRWTIYGPQDNALPGVYKSEHFMLSHHLAHLSRARKIEPVTESEGEAGERLWQAL